MSFIVLVKDPLSCSTASFIPESSDGTATLSHTYPNEVYNLYGFGNS